MIEIRFYLRGECNQETETRKIYNEDCTFDGDIPLTNIIVHDFIHHLRTCGYSEELIKMTLREESDKIGRSF